MERGGALAWAMVYGGSLVYAVVRYVVFAPSNREHIPVFVFNKGLSMAAALCFSLAFWIQYRRRRQGHALEVPDPGAAGWFRAGMAGAVAHIPLSLSILQPAYFPEFFRGERFHFLGECVVLLGGASAAGLYLLTRTRLPDHARWLLSMIFLTTLSGHVLAMGWCRGIHLNARHAYLPPMWLLSLIGLAAGWAYCARTRPGPSSS
jgi:hypothetical protein